MDLLIPSAHRSDLHDGTADARGRYSLCGGAAARKESHRPNAQRRSSLRADGTGPAHSRVMMKLERILVATDFGESSDAALAYGRVLARELGAVLHVLNVVDDVFTRGLEAESIGMWSTFQDDLEATAIGCLERRVPPEDRRRFGDQIVTRVSSQPATRSRLMSPQSLELELT
jgi:Universal stress protein family